MIMYIDGRVTIASITRKIICCDMASGGRRKAMIMLAHKMKFGSGSFRTKTVFVTSMTDSIASDHNFPFLLTEPGTPSESLF